MDDFKDKLCKFVLVNRTCLSKDLLDEFLDTHYEKSSNVKCKFGFKFEDIRSIINDIFLSNFYDKKSKNAILVGIDELNMWITYFKLLDFEDFPTIFNDNVDSIEIHHTINEDLLNSYIKARFNVVYDILVLGQGKISLCGGALINILKQSLYGRPKDFDLFFHGCSIQEADDLLLKCLSSIKCIYKNSCTYSRSQGVFTVETEKFQIQFIRRIYENKSQILLGFDLAACRHGWNPIDGYFSTICGAMSFAMGSFPIDVTQRSLSHGHRLNKYINKGFRILLPGLPEGFREDIETPDGKILYMENNIFSFVQNYDKLFSDYDNQIYKEDKYTNQNYTYDSSLNWLLITNNKDHNVTFQSSSLSNILDITDETIFDSIASTKLFGKIDDKINDTKLNILKKFLGPKYESYIKITCLDNNQIEGNKIWEDRCTYYIDRGKEIAKMINDQPWRYINPGGQNFGKLNPVIEDPRLFYGDNYVPVVVGISDDRYVAFASCTQCMNYDIRKIICQYWFTYEVSDARTRLFNLQ